MNNLKTKTINSLNKTSGFSLQAKYLFDLGKTFLVPAISEMRQELTTAVLYPKNRNRIKNEIRIHEKYIRSLARVSDSPSKISFIDLIQ